MVDLSVLYRYQWRGADRAMRAHLLDTTVMVTEVHPVTCEETEPVGIFQWVDGALVGTDELSDTRRSAIAALLAVATAPDPVTR
jgi:hypothetical protein